ncbi:MAG: hypothetical protein IKR69_04075 [Bacteroidales bacterium]|nr:hypothetical protein [Bacteroidales bacterium]
MRYIPAYRFLLPVLLLLASACAKLADDNGPGKNVDRVSLSLSVASAGSADTKMTAVITQDGSGFRGIEEVFVVPFQTSSAAPVSTGDPRLGSRNVYIENSGIAQSGLVANNNSHLYNIVSIPNYTNRVLAYGKSSDVGTVSTTEGKHRNGVLTAQGLDNPNTSGDISFCLEPVLETADLTAVNQTADNLIDALNAVVGVLQASGDTDILAFLDVFAAENEISACSYQTIYRFEQSILGALSNYAGSNPEAINTVMARLSELQSARNAAGSGFPATYGVPEGAVGMWWNGHRFVKQIVGVNISLVPMARYCYPPSLWYYANSAIKTSADDSVHEQYKPQNNTWGSILSYYTQGAYVTSNTRSVAIVDQMQYGNALLELRFVAPTGNAAAAGGCPLTGIIIGDQKDVDYSFAPKATSTDWFVYDNNISGVTLGGTSQYVQLLVLPTTDEQTVHFALEFQNTTASSFLCQQGTVKPGCKFYLAGELDPNSGVGPGSGNIAGVFDSDRKTTVYVRVNDLSKAYNAVPDLRDPQLELGVDAEMDWVQVEPGGIKLPF